MSSFLEEKGAWFSAFTAWPNSHCASGVAEGQAIQSKVSQTSIEWQMHSFKILREVFIAVDSAQVQWELCVENFCSSWTFATVNLRAVHDKLTHTIAFHCRHSVPLTVVIPASLTVSKFQNLKAIVLRISFTGVTNKFRVPLRTANNCRARSWVEGVDQVATLHVKSQEVNGTGFLIIDVHQDTIFSCGLEL